jgi:uncharacterized membrane protein
MNAEDFSGLSDSHGDDREWQCLRYVLGEMPAAEADAFEELLAADQEAREQVARCVELVAGTYCAAEQTLTGSERNADRRLPAEVATADGRTRRQGRRWSLAAAAAAICLAVVAGLYLFTLRAPRAIDGPLAHDALDNGAGPLVAIWSEWLSESTLDPDLPEFAISDRPEEPASEERPTVGQASDDRSDELVAQGTEDRPGDTMADADQVAKDFRVPGWLMAAVTDGDGRELDAASPEIREN